MGTIMAVKSKKRYLSPHLYVNFILALQHNRIYSQPGSQGCNYRKSICKGYKNRNDEKEKRFYFFKIYFTLAGCSLSITMDYCS